MGRRLTEPLALAATQLIRVTKPWNPGYYDHEMSLFNEMIRRVCLVAQVLFFLIIGLLPWLVGKGILACVSLFRNDFVIRQLQHPPAVQPSALKLVTYNASLGLECVDASWYLRSGKERLNTIVEAIVETDADVVCLQEAFDEDLAESLVGELQKRGHYPYAIYNVGHHAWSLNSGLLMLSKYPLENPAFLPHNEATGADYFANKGVLAATVVMPEKKAAIFNIHLNAGFSILPWVERDMGQVHACRSRQLHACKELIDKYVSQHALKSDSVILSGDFNDRSPWLQGFTRLSCENENGTFFALLPEQDPARPNVGWDLSYDKWPVYWGCLDHILLPEAKMSQEAKILRMRGASDHLAVQCSIPV